jgi:hypothetical protein
MTYSIAMGFAYTIATGRLFCPMVDFHSQAEALLGRPIFTHEFADKATWAELRDAFETLALEAIR